MNSSALTSAGPNAAPSVTHLCAETECPYLGQASSRGCRCHKTREQMLETFVVELLDVARNFVRWAEDPAATPVGFARELEWLNAAKAAIAKASPTDGAEPDSAKVREPNPSNKAGA